MNPRKGQVSLALRLWIFVSVFVIPFLSGWEVGLWLLPGAALALWWRSLPEDPPEPPPRLPYQHLYDRPRKPD